MKNILKSVVLLLALLMTAGMLHAQKFGYVNSAALLDQMPEVKQADANLEALQKQLQKKGQNMLANYQTKAQELQGKAERGELSPIQQEEEAKKLQAEEQEILQFEQSMYQQIQDKRAELLKPIFDKINEAIANVAKENGYQFIFDANVLLYATDEQDVSTKVKAKLGI